MISDSAIEKITKSRNRQSLNLFIFNFQLLCFTLPYQKKNITTTLPNDL